MKIRHPMGLHHPVVLHPLHHPIVRHPTISYSERENSLAVVLQSMTLSTENATSPNPRISRFEMEEIALQMH